MTFGFQTHPNSETLGVEAAYYGHLNLVEYFVEKSGAEPSKVTLNLGEGFTERGSTQILAVHSTPW